MKELALALVFSAFLWQSYWLDVTEDDLAVNKETVEVQQQTIATLMAKNINLHEDVKSLRKANSCLMAKKSIMACIKDTPLPSLEKGK